MTNRQNACRQIVCLLVAFAYWLLPFAFCLPAVRAQQASRGYESAFRYPSVVPAVIESMAVVQWRERFTGVPQPDPGTAPAFRNPLEEPGRVRLVPGARQSAVVVPASGALPPPGFALPLLAGTPATSPLPDVKFDTVAWTGDYPPDDAIAAGPTHLVCAVNSYLQVRTFSGALVSNTAFPSFFPAEPTHSLGDPRVVFDTASGRFIFSAIGSKSTLPQASTCVIAVSATSDPTGVWYKYVLNVGRGGSTPTEEADYDCLGYDGTAIYVSFNMFSFSTGRSTGNRLLIIDKSQALNGQALTGPVIVDNILLPNPPIQGGTTAFSLLPVEAAEPVSPALMMSTAGSIGLALYKITDPLGKSGGPSITASFIDTTDFATPAAAPQSGSAIGIDSGDTRLEKTVLRNGVIWTAHTVSSTGSSGGKAQINLYKVLPSGDGTLLDAKSIVDPVLSFYYPAVVPDAFGDATLVFAGSSPTSFASIYSARYEGATSQIDIPILVDAGLSTYVQVFGGRNRWGDYFDASLDVLSGTHVWTQGEIPIAPQVTGAGFPAVWQMRAAHIPTSPPVPPTNLTAVAASPTEVDLTWTDNGFEESGFKIERKSPTDADFSLLAMVGPGITKYADTTVTPGTTYTYRVRAFNGAGDSAPSNEATVTAPSSTANLSSLVLAPNPVTGGSPVVGIVTLTGPAPSDLTVSLSSSSPSIANPTTSSLSIPAGSTSQSFTVTTTAISGSPAAVTITATLNGASKSATLTVK